MNNPRPTDVVSAGFLKRDLIQDVIGNLTEAESGFDEQAAGLKAEQNSNYYLEDMVGNAVDGKDCDILYDDDSGDTMCECSSSSIRIVGACPR
jgi:hypothetical protein